MLIQNNLEMFQFSDKKERKKYLREMYFHYVLKDGAFYGKKLGKKLERVVDTLWKQLFHIFFVGDFFILALVKKLFLLFGVEKMFIIHSRNSFLFPFDFKEFLSS